jgi:hypothetical protein
MKVPAAIGIVLPQSNAAKTLAACDVSPQLRYGPILLQVRARGSMLFGERVRPATFRIIHTKRISSHASRPSSTLGPPLCKTACGVLPVRADELIEIEYNLLRCICRLLARLRHSKIADGLPVSVGMCCKTIFMDQIEQY